MKHLLLVVSLLSMPVPSLLGQVGRPQGERRVHNPGPSIVTIQGTQMLVQRRQLDGSLSPASALKMRGVGYAPVPVCDTIASRQDNRDHTRNADHEVDFDLIRRMNGNVVKTYVDLGTDDVALEILDSAYRHGMWVLITLVPDAAHDPGEDSNQQIIEAYRDHPALLGWIVGNEWNLNRFYFYPDLASAAADAEATVQLVQGLDPNHPVASSLGFLPSDLNLGPRMATSAFPGMVAGVPSADFWAMNVYRGVTFDPWFLEWPLLSSKPFFFGEFGTDAWETADLATGNGSLDETLQADTDRMLWDQMHRNLSAIDPAQACLGGTVFQWIDGWWKAGNPCGHDVGGFAQNLVYSDFRQGGVATTFVGQPDQYSNEEHYGLLRLDGSRKPAYRALRKAFGLGTLRTQPITLTTHSQGGGANAYYWMGRDDQPFTFAYANFAGFSGHRGFNVAVLDRRSGSVRWIRNYDTYGAPVSAATQMAADLATVPEGDLVIVAVADTPVEFVSFCTPMGSIASLAPAVTALQDLGATLASSLTYWQPYGLIAEAGSPGLNLAEAVGVGSCASGLFADVELNTAVVLDADGDGLLDDVDPDNDNDGVLDVVERANGTDVLDPASF